MDWSFTEEQDDVRALARRILTDKLTEERMREVAAGTERIDRDTWKALADAGLLGIALPESVGGAGYGVLEQCLVLEEAGRTVAPVPVLPTIVMGAAPIAEFGTDEQRSGWAAPAAAGDVLLTAALAEPLNRDPRTPTTTATADGVLAGEKTRVPIGLLADAILVPATTPDGPRVFLVERGADGLTAEPQGDDAHLVLDGVRGEAVGGAEVLPWLVERTTLGLCAMQLGVLARALEMTAEYAKSRVQFDRPIATFQAVGQRCADAYIDVEGVRLTLLQAAWKVGTGEPADDEVAVAKFWAAEAGHRVAHTAVHIHGGVGVDTDYPLHRYYVAAKRIELTLGGATDQLLRIGAAMAEGA